MSDSNANSYIPSSGIELNLAAKDDQPDSDQWDANAKTHLTHGQMAQAYGDDYVPQHERSFPGLADEFPPLGGHYLDNGESGDVEDNDAILGDRQPLLNGPRVILLMVGMALGGWILAPSLGFNPEALLSGLMDEPELELSRPPSRPLKAKQPTEKQASRRPAQQGARSGAPEALRRDEPLRGVAQPASPANAGRLSYHSIPIPELHVEALGRVWNAEEDETWRNGIHHRFTWQRYKTVMDVRRARFQQSNIILWDALEDEKFWIRMRALMGLADFGVPVAASNIQKALGSASDAQMEHFFKRFHRASVGERYVLRQTVGLVSPAVRLTILEALSKARDEYAGLYLTAATSDPALEVRAWAGRRLARMPLVQRQQWAEELAQLQRQPLPQARAVPEAPADKKSQPVTAGQGRGPGSVPAGEGRMPIKDLKTYHKQTRESASVAEPQAAAFEP